MIGARLERRQRLSGDELRVVTAIGRLIEFFFDAVFIGQLQQLPDPGGIGKTEAAAIGRGGLCRPCKLGPFTIAHVPIALAVQGGEKVGAVRGVFGRADDAGKALFVDEEGGAPIGIGDWCLTR